MERETSRPTRTRNSENKDNNEKNMDEPSSDNSRGEYFESGYDDSDDLLGECPDTEGLGYHHIRGMDVIGYIESVNGTGATPCWDFEATRFEMLVIAKHWYRELCDIDLFWFQHQTTTGSTEWRTARYASRRIHRIRRLISDGPVDKVGTEVDGELREIPGESEWRQFEAQR